MTQINSKSGLSNKIDLTIKLKSNIQTILIFQLWVILCVFERDFYFFYKIEIQ